MLDELNMSALPSLYNQFVKLIEYLVIVSKILLFCFSTLANVIIEHFFYIISTDEK